MPLLLRQLALSYVVAPTREALVVLSRQVRAVGRELVRP